MFFRAFVRLSAALILFACLAPLARAADPVVSGLVDDQVLQQSPEGHVSFEVKYRPSARGARSVRFQIESLGMPAPGQAWKNAERDGRIWTIAVKALPTGGPYDLAIEALDGDGDAVDSRRVRGFLVGDLWVLGGQSNMEGVGLLKGAERPSAAVHMFDMSDIWRLASEPLHERAQGLYPVYWDVGNPKGAKRLTGEAAVNSRIHRREGAGLGLPFAKELSSKTGVPIGLIPCAYGGTSMDQWSPDKKGEGNESLYGAMMNRIASVGGRVRGVLWYQGESDASPEGAKVYAEKMKKFVQAIRDDSGISNLPFYYVQIGRFVQPTNDNPGWDAVQELERALEAEIPHSGVVPTIDLELDDAIHADTEGLKIVGRRLALLAGIDLYPQAAAFKGMKRGPRIGKIGFVEGNRRLLRVQFDGVNGKLVSAGRLSGFSFIKPETAVAPPYKCYVDPADGQSILFQFQDEVPAGTQLYYGRGLDPYCNVGDEAGMAVLACGPINIE